MKKRHDHPQRRRPYPHKAKRDDDTPPGVPPASLRDGSPDWVASLRPVRGWLWHRITRLGELALEVLEVAGFGLVLALLAAAAVVLWLVL